MEIIPEGELFQFFSAKEEHLISEIRSQIVKKNVGGDIALGNLVYHYHDEIDRLRARLDEIKRSSTVS